MYESKQKGDLKRHVLTHTGEKPWKCNFSECGYACCQSGGLKNHILTHTGEKPWKCNFPECEYACTTSGNLKKHILTHTGEKPWKCNFPECGFACTASGGLKKHNTAIHSERGQQRHKKREEHIHKLLVKHGIDFKREHYINFKCADDKTTYCRVDFVILRNGHLIFLEIDEDQHKTSDPSCDVSRMTKIYESLAIGGNTLPITFIRFNPDVYRICDDRQKMPNKKRDAKLIEIINDPTHVIYTNTKPMAIHYMYYDTNGGKLPSVTFDVSYNKAIIECLIY